MQLSDLARGDRMVRRQPHNSTLVIQAATKRLRDPERSVGRELETLAVVELLNRSDKAKRTLLDQVFKRKVVIVVPLGNVHDQTQVGVDHLLLGCEIALLD